MPPDYQLLGHLNAQFPCRELQIRSLATLLQPTAPSPSCLVVHGTEAVGKSAIVQALLEGLEIPHALISSRECITGRHLLEHTLAACTTVIAPSDPESAGSTRCESLNTLQVCLQRLLQTQDKFVLVFDGIDRQREAYSSLIPALMRMGETVPALIVLLIVSSPSPRIFHSTGVPHIHFPSYVKEELIRILSLSPLPIWEEPPDTDYDPETATEESAWVWTRFCSAVWDTIAKGAARDLNSFRDVCERLWRPFVAPIVSGSYGTRDFSRLLVAKRTLFQGEEALINNMLVAEESQAIKAVEIGNHELPYYSKLLLCAAYLASYNSPRQDQIYFVKSSDKKRKRRGGAQAGTKPTKHRKIPRSMLAPSPFPLDRLLAILHALTPHPLPQTSDLLTQLTTLVSLRLILRAGTSGSDVLDGTTKWRINCSSDYVVALGRAVGVEMRDYLADN
ncbi:hypothetical protein EJ06DRAFT_539559 [Trichodelitschia bisporula]|uniref:Uncharacterized protein n=1 Tax=Trichodelitschia bisporula TaxID=703511 RepID=A0A6G1HMB2_9PEZI|nr:hypothetical protein EJ06DRAFT_539559 [Trichodelitschia bisporula]